MNNILYLSLVFGMGLLTNILLSIKHIVWEDKWKFLAVFLFSLLAFIPDSNTTYNIYSRIAIFFVFLCFFFVLFFRKELLIQTDEFFLATINISVIFLAIEKSQWLLFFLIPLSGITIYFIIKKTPPSHDWKIISYIWFMILSIILLAMSFSLWTFLFIPPEYVSLTLGETFAGGMLFATLMINVSHLLTILPLKIDKYQSWKDRKVQIKEIMKDFLVKFDDTQIKGIMWIILLVIAIALLINYILSLINQLFLISIILILFSVMNRIKMHK